jgi:[ribosomal protein S5]-alanine N-acetyltransferase
MEIKDLFLEMPIFETLRTILRKMNIDDAKEMFEYSSNREVTKYLSYDHMSIEEAEKYIQNKVEKYAQGECMIWGIEHKENRKYIGACGFTHWDTENNCAEIAYSLNQDYWGRGIMGEIVDQLFQFGFEKMNLNRIEARCWSENNKSVRIMEKNNMKFEGIIREQIYVKGKYRDVKMYSILKREYKKQVVITNKIL